MTRQSTVYFTGSRVDGLCFGMNLHSALMWFGIKSRHDTLLRVYEWQKEKLTHIIVHDLVLSTPGGLRWWRELVTTSAFCAQPPTSRAQWAHYPHIGTHTHALTHTPHLTQLWQCTDSVVEKTNENILQVQNFYLGNCVHSVPVPAPLDRWRIAVSQKETQL